MARIQAVLLLGAVLGLTVACDLLGDAEGTSFRAIPFDQVREAGVLQVDEPGTRVLRDAAGWQTFWTSHTDAAVPPPAVDFGARMLIVLSWGARDGCSNYVELIDAVIVREGLWRGPEMEVSLLPFPLTVCPAVTHPIQVVSVARHPGPVTFSGNVPAGAGP